MTRSPRASDLTKIVLGQKLAAGRSGSDVTRNTGMRLVAASVLQAAPAQCAWMISMRSEAISCDNFAALPRMRKGLTLSFAIGSHSPPKARSSPTSGPPSPATMARAPDCSSVNAMSTAAWLAGSSRNAGTSCRMVAPVSERGLARRRFEFAPLRSASACGENGSRSLSTVLANLAEARMSESRLITLRIESPPPARTIAVRLREGKSHDASRNGGSGLFWLGGLKSDMKGTKAAALDEWAQSQGRACIRFDYSGHGESGGDFTGGTIGRWLEESLSVYRQFAKEQQVVIGSSMGGWLALLLARKLRKHKAAAPMAGMVLIAPAVDFTEELMWKKFSQSIKEEIEQKGAWMRPSLYSEQPYPITKKLIEEGREHLMLGGLIETGCPVHILQGVQDPDVPWRHAQELVARFARDDVVLTLIKDGDHRLSRPEDIERLIAAVKEFS